MEHASIQPEPSGVPEYELPPEIEAVIEEGRRHPARRVPYRRRGGQPQDESPGRCWCCGEECMFCLPEDQAFCTDGGGVHWCANCKFGGQAGHACYPGQ